MGAVGGKISGKTSGALGSTSGSSSSSNSLNTHRENADKEIKVEENDKYKAIDYIISVEIPATNSGITLLNKTAKILTGSKFVHEGLIIKTYDTYYVCQTYPIQLKKCENEKDAINKIKGYWAVNENVEDKNLKKTYLVPYEQYCMSCLKETVENLPNKYDLFTYNCQHFCSKIKKNLGLHECKLGPPIARNMIIGYSLLNSCSRHGNPFTIK